MDDMTPKLTVVSSQAQSTVVDVDWPMLIQEYQAGISPDVLSAKYRVGRATIFRRLKKLGLSGPTRKAIQERAEQKMLAKHRKKATGRIKPLEVDNEDEENEIAELEAEIEALLEGNADTLAGITVRHQKVLSKSRRAVQVMLDRFMKAECTKTVFTKTGLPVVVSASDEIKNLANCLKTIIPLERQAYGLDTDKDEENRKAAEKAARDAANQGIAAVLQALDEAKGIAKSGNRHSRVG